MGLETVYFGILNKLEAIAQNFQYEGAAAFKKVIIGFKSGVTTFPMCFILPDPASISPASTARDKWTFRFIIAIVTEKADVVEGLKSAMKLACAMYDQLVSDRLLEGKADNLEVTRIEFHYRRTPSFTRHWAAIHLEVFKYF